MQSQRIPALLDQLTSVLLYVHQMTFTQRKSRKTITDEQLHPCHLTTPRDGNGAAFIFAFSTQVPANGIGKSSGEIPWSIKPGEVKGVMES